MNRDLLEQHQHKAGLSPTPCETLYVTEDEIFDLKLPAVFCLKKSTNLVNYVVKNTDGGKLVLQKNHGKLL